MLKHKCWNTDAGTQMLEHRCWNTNAGTQVLEHKCWNTDAETQMQKHNAETELELMLKHSVDTYAETQC
jgi:hypothetical protein